MNTNLESFAADFLTECCEDYVGLWSVIRDVKAMGVEESQLQRVLLEFFSRLLKERKIVAGTFAGTEFIPWSEPVALQVSRIQREWDALPHGPDLGDVVWFTSAGKTVSM